MKIFFLLFCILIFNISAFALEVQEVWSTDYKPQLKILCSEGEEGFCSQACPANSFGKLCIVEQKVCRDCIGTSLFVTDIFEGMSVRYRNRGDEVSIYEFIDLIASKNFVTFSAKSVYNHVDSFDSLNLQKKFQSLCPAYTKSPAVVFFDLKNKSNILNKVRYVACDKTFFTMSEDALIDVENQYKNLKIKFY